MLIDNIKREIIKFQTFENFQLRTTGIAILFNWEMKMHLEHKYIGAPPDYSLVGDAPARESITPPCWVRGRGGIHFDGNEVATC